MYASDDEERLIEHLIREFEGDYGDRPQITCSDFEGNVYMLVDNFAAMQTKEVLTHYLALLRKQ